MRTTSKIVMSAVVAIGLSAGAYATCASDVDMGSNKITNVGTPTADTDAANKAYVDSVATTDSTAVVINGQTWAAKNAYVNHYPDGTLIAHPFNGTVQNTFSYAETGTATNTESNQGDIVNEQWGSLYQWDAAMNDSTTEGAQGICSSGWHIPTHQEFIDLFHGLDSTVSTLTTGVGWTGTNAGTKAKLGGSSGFGVKLDGSRNTAGGFYGRTDHTKFWSSTQSSSSLAYQWRLNSSNSDVYRQPDIKKNGFSVRCIKD